VVLVVEGAARPAADDAAGPVRVLAAPGSGDDTIAVLAEHAAGRRIVVTADRELRQRSVAAGAAVAGPSWLLGLI
jgi:rRNA-processing protein FCF1